MSHENDVDRPPPMNDREGPGSRNGDPSSVPPGRDRSLDRSGGDGRRRPRSRSYSPDRRRPRSRSRSPPRRSLRDRSYSPDRDRRYRDGYGGGGGGGGGGSYRDYPPPPPHPGGRGPPPHPGPGRGGGGGDFRGGDYGPPPPPGGRYYDDRYYPRDGPRDGPRGDHGPPRGPPPHRGGGGGGGGRDNRRSRGGGGGGGGGGMGEESSIPGVSLLVRNVSPDITTQDLQRAFGRIGEIRDVYIPRDYHSQQPKGFAFIEYATADQAEEAREEMDRFVIKGRELEVVFAQEKRKTPNEMRGRVVNQQNRGRDRSTFERSSSFDRHRRDQPEPHMHGGGGGGGGGGPPPEDEPSHRVKDEN
ncbi:hypothetical protein ACA910_000029 [Epithemia clementina (nom. ined.)]